MMCDIKLFYSLVLINWSEIVLGRSDAENHDMSKPTEKKKLLIDTDAGSDDGVAILNILSAELLFHEVEVQLITTVSGNTHVDNVSRNVLKILKTVHRLDIPVHKGASQSLLVTPTIEDFFGKDGFGDFHFPSPPSEDLIKTDHAALALIKEVLSHPGELTLVCLGPLTNIALAVRLEPQFLQKLKEIYVLGGSDSGMGNIKPGVEFNFYMDPEAAFIVLKEAEKCEKIVNLVPWETPSIRSPVEMKWRKNVLGSLQDPKVELINKAEGKVLEGENWISADTVLSSVVINPEIVESSDVYHADLEISGEHARGALFVDYSHETNLTKNIRIIKKINVEEHKRLLLQHFNSYEVLKSTASRR